MISLVRMPPRFVALAILLSACRSTAPIPAATLPPPELPVPRVRSEWLATQAAVMALTNENKGAAADSSLTQFMRDFAHTLEGDRAYWWRTLMRADPRIGTGDAAVALAQVDSLLADSISTEVRAEALLMRRTIGAIDSLRRGEVRRRTQATQLAGERLDELKVARDSLTKLQAEIQRLRKRLRVSP
ncbi:MAG: hypothetical protein V4813_08460 [Gemmatimonadota bacterium]